MRFWLLALLCVTAVRGDNLALTIRAQTDFDRVLLSSVPQVQDVAACEQSQAALIPVARPEELALLHYRKGYCTLLDGLLTHNQRTVQGAAGEFQKAVESWPARSPEPVTSALPVLISVARLQASPEASALAAIDAELSAAVSKAACPAAIMPAGACNSLIETGRFWLAWIAGRQGRWNDAERISRTLPAPAWHAWFNGQAAMERGRYPEAISGFRQAAEGWSGDEKYAQPVPERLLRPSPELTAAYQRLGEAQLLAGAYQDAVGSLNVAVKRQPSDARAIFLRGRAKDLLGRTDDAIADYQLASRTAFAADPDLASSGEAHYYRGVWLFRRNDFERAEEEFASALNFGVPASLRPDVTAWRQMAAVAHGACQTAASLLERNLPFVSGFFPKTEARTLLHSCPSGLDVISRK